MHRFALALALAMSTAGPAAARDVAQAPAPEDRYLWLEDVTGERALAWVRARNAESAKVLETGDFASLEKRILDILDSEARIPYVRKIGPLYYNFWQDAKNPRGLWRRTTLERVPQAEPGLGDRARPGRPGRGGEGELGLARGDCLKPSTSAASSSSPAAGRTPTWYASSTWRPSTSSRTASPCPRPRAAWAGSTPNHLFVGTDFGPGSMTASGYPRIARLWTRGTPLASAVTVFEGKPGRRRGHRLPRPREASSGTSSSAHSRSTRTSCSCAETAS